MAGKGGEIAAETAGEIEEAPQLRVVDSAGQKGAVPLQRRGDAELAGLGDEEGEEIAELATGRAMAVGNSRVRATVKKSPVRGKPAATASKLAGVRMPRERNRASPSLIVPSPLASCRK